MTLLRTMAIIVLLCVQDPKTSQDLRIPMLPTESYWQTGSSCGPNVLYCLLRIHGREVDYDELLTYLSPPAEGSSLEELRRAALHWGLEIKAVEVRVDQLDGPERPFIAHMNHQGATHYVLVLGRERGRVEFWEPSSAERVGLDEVEFVRRWTGYALVTGSSSRRHLLQILVPLEAFCLLIALIFRIRAFRTKAS